MADPTPETLKQDAERASREGRVRDALELCRTYLKRVPGDLEVRQWVADLLLRMDRPADAVRSYEHVAASFAQSGHLFKSLAITNVIQQIDPGATRAQDQLAATVARGSGRASSSTEDTAIMPRHATPSAPRLAMGHVTPVAVARAPVNESFHLEIDVDDIIHEAHADAPPVDPAALPHFPLFSDLHPDEFVALLRRVTVRSFNAGDAIVTEGEPGACMFAVAQGSVRVFRRRADGTERELKTLGEGEFFGEGALLGGTMRMASVSALDHVVLLELSRDAVDAACATHPGMRDVIERFHRQRMLDNLVRASAFFRPFSPEQQDAIIRAFRPRTAATGEVLLQQGQPGDGFYVLLRGRCVAFHTQEDGRERAYPELGEGDVFGEISLLLQKPCTATVRALTPVVALRMPREDFERLVLSHPKVRHDLEDLSHARRRRTADLLTAIMLGIETIRV